MKPILVDVTKVKQPVKGPFLPYVPRARLERAVRKFRPGKLKPKQPYLEFVPAPWSADALLILPRPPVRLLACAWKSAWVRDASGKGEVKFWVDCGLHGGSRGVCGYMEVFPSAIDSLKCSMFQSTCRGACHERRGTGPLGIELRLWCECTGV